MPRIALPLEIEEWEIVLRALSLVRHGAEASAEDKAKATILWRSIANSLDNLTAADLPDSN